jgi:hypothetical protein
VPSSISQPSFTSTQSRYASGRENSVCRKSHYGSITRSRRPATVQVHAAVKNKEYSSFTAHHLSGHKDVARRRMNELCLRQELSHHKRRELLQVGHPGSTWYSQLLPSFLNSSRCSCKLANKVVRILLCFRYFFGLHTQQMLAGFLPSALRTYTRCKRVCMLECCHSALPI